MSPTIVLIRHAQAEQSVLYDLEKRDDVYATISMHRWSADRQPFSPPPSFTTSIRSSSCAYFPRLSPLRLSASLQQCRLQLANHRSVSYFAGARTSAFAAQSLSEALRICRRVSDKSAEKNYSNDLDGFSGTEGSENPIGDLAGLVRLSIPLMLQGKRVIDVPICRQETQAHPCVSSLLEIDELPHLC